MGPATRKTIVVSAVLLGVAAAAAAAVALKDPLLEEWHLHQLRSGNPEERHVAAGRLGDLGSVRAVPLLLEGIRLEDEETHWRWFSLHSRHPALEWLGEEFQTPTQLAEILAGEPHYDALMTIHRTAGQRTIPYFVEALEHDDDFPRYVCLIFLADLGPQAVEAIDAIQQARTQSPELQAACDRALRRILGPQP